MIDPKSVQDIVRRAVTKHSDMLVAQVSTPDEMVHQMPEYIARDYIKREVCSELGHYLAGKSFIETSKNPNRPMDTYHTGRVLVIPYLQLDQFIATLTCKIIEELQNGNYLELPRELGLYGNSPTI